MTFTIRLILCGFIFGCFLLSMERIYREWYWHDHILGQCVSSGGRIEGSMCVYLPK